MDRITRNDTISPSLGLYIKSEDRFGMKAAASLSVILVAAILALGDGAYLRTDNRETEMDAIERVLNQEASNEYLEELKDQPTHTPTRNELAYRLSVLSQQDTPSSEYLEELKDQPTRKQSLDKNELAYMQLLSLFKGSRSGATTNPDKITQGDEVAFQTYMRNEYIGCSGTYCTPTTGPGLYMDTDDWDEHPATTFQIYRMHGEGDVMVGEAVALYYPKDKKWMMSSGLHLVKDTCPGEPSEEHGMEDDEKWYTCPESVFKIYAKGKSVGDDILRGDDIALYIIRDSKWFASESSFIQKTSCSGTSRPLSDEMYDSCYKEVFELLKR